MPVPTRRSTLQQDRSRQTRRGIIKAALELWTERGYDTGIDDTTAEEISARAGVSKATFYLHFARKEDLLFEAGWITAEVLYEDAVNALLGTGSADEIIDALIVRLCRRVKNVPRSALRRMLQVIQSPAESRVWDPDHFGFQRAFTEVFVHGQRAGQIPETVPAHELGAMLEAHLYAAIRDWAYDESFDMLGVTRVRSALVLAGARNVTAEAITGARDSSPGRPPHKS